MSSRSIFDSIDVFVKNQVILLARLSCQKLPKSKTRKSIIHSFRFLQCAEYKSKAIQNLELLQNVSAELISKMIDTLFDDSDLSEIAFGKGPSTSKDSMDLASILEGMNFESKSDNEKLLKDLNKLIISQLKLVKKLDCNTTEKCNLYKQEAFEELNAILEITEELMNNLESFFQKEQEIKDEQFSGLLNQMEASGTLDDELDKLVKQTEAELDKEEAAMGGRTKEDFKKAYNMAMDLIEGEIVESSTEGAEWDPSEKSKMRRSTKKELKRSRRARAGKYSERRRKKKGSTGGLSKLLEKL